MAENGEEMQPSLPLPLPADLHGDLLESIMSKVAMMDLLPASYVSRAWRHAVASSLRHSPRVKPWIVLCLRHASVAYDPQNRTWLPLPLPLPLPYNGNNIRSSHPQLLYALVSPSNLSIAEPLSATWTDLPLPHVGRVDPVVALVGSRVVVAGGTWEFEDAAPGAVEYFDLHSQLRQWQLCDPIPNEISSSATCLSVATSDDDTMYVLDKNSGMFSSFDAENGRWSGTCDLRPDPAVRLSAIGFSVGRLILAVLSDDPLSLTLWGLDPDNLDCKEEIGRMPKEMAERLVGEGVGSMVTIGFSTVGDYAYLYNPACFQEAFFYEFAERRWESTGRPQEVDDDPTAKITFTCCTVGFDRLNKIFPRRS